MKITFSINLHSSDGEVQNEGIFLHIEDRLILGLKSFEELKEMIKSLEKVRDEISDVYQ